MARNIDWVTKEELHRITGRDRRTINLRLEKGGVPFKQEGRSRLFDKMLAIEAIASKDNDIGHEAKERRAIADAEKAELLVARLRGELVPVADMKTAAAELIKTLYMRVVRVTPSILAPKLLGLTDALEIEARLRTALADAFNELKSMPDHFLTVEGDQDLSAIIPAEPTQPTTIETKTLSMTIE